MDVTTTTLPAAEHVGAELLDVRAVVALLSSVLRSKRGVRVNIEITRASVRLHHVLAAYKELARRLDELEARVRELMELPPAPKRGRIGFRPHDED